MIIQLQWIRELWLFKYVFVFIFLPWGKCCKGKISMPIIAGDSKGIWHTLVTALAFVFYEMILLVCGGGLAWCVQVTLFPWAIIYTARPRTTLKNLSDRSVWWEISFSTTWLWAQSHCVVCCATSTLSSGRAK